MPETEFEACYSGLFGKRWPKLRAALLAPNDAVDFSAGLIKPYRMDRASIEAAMALPLPASGEILDACAAPGGKTLVLASRVQGSALTIIANELSSDRRRRLSSVLDEYLPPAVRSAVTVSGFDAAAAGSRLSERGRFGAILLDAPCSSERHIIQSAHALNEWTQARIKFLSRRQWALVSSAFLMLAEGCSIVYSSCALSDDENDNVIARLFKKYPSAVLNELHPSRGAEQTRFGIRYMPDMAGGSGPLYIASVCKKSGE